MLSPTAAVKAVRKYNEALRLGDGKAAAKVLEKAHEIEGFASQEWAVYFTTRTIRYHGKVVVEKDTKVIAYEAPSVGCYIALLDPIDEEWELWVPESTLIWQSDIFTDYAEDPDPVFVIRFKSDKEFYVQHRDKEITSSPDAEDARRFKSEAVAKMHASKVRQRISKKETMQVYRVILPTLDRDARKTKVGDVL